jgi:hypothetical protein
MKLEFWNVDIIIDNYRKNTPHITEEKHDCNCEYCDHHEVSCSNCWRIEDDNDDFRDEKLQKHRCRSCWKELLTESAFKSFLKIKKKCYILQTK